MRRACTAVALVFVFSCLEGSSHAADPAPAAFTDLVAQRAGSTVFQEASRTLAAVAGSGAAALVAHHAPGGLAAVAVRPLATALYYAGYKAGSDAVAGSLARARGQEPPPLDLREIGLVSISATAGSLVAGRLLGPVAGGWIGQWMGWAFAETLADRERRGHGWDPAGAVREMDLPRIAAAAVTTEAAGLAAVRLAGLDPSLPVMGASMARVLVGLTAKVLAMSAVTTVFDPAYDRLTGAGRTPTTTAPAAAPGDAYRRLLDDLRGGDPERARASLRAYEESRAAGRADAATCESSRTRHSSPAPADGR